MRRKKRRASCRCRLRFGGREISRYSHDWDDVGFCRECSAMRCNKIVWSYDRARRCLNPTTDRSGALVDVTKCSLHCELESLDLDDLQNTPYTNSLTRH